MKNEFDAMSQQPENAKAERVLLYGHDTIVLKQISDTDDFAVIGKELIFDRSYKHNVLKTNSFPLESGRLAKIIGMRVSTNLKFDNAGDELAFYEYAQIKVNIEDKDYSPIPLVDLIPFNFTPANTYVGGEQKYKKLAQAIIPPHDGKITLEFDPQLKNVKTDAVSTNGTKFGANIVDQTDSPVYWIKISYVAELLRSTR